MTDLPVILAMSPLVIGTAVLAVIAVTIGFLLARSGNRPPVPGAAASGDRPSPPPVDDQTPQALLDVHELAARLKTSVQELQQHETAYHTVEIPKPKGGLRRLEIPDPDTRELQREILRLLLNGLSSHPFACGFEAHTSIVDAALPHQKKAVVIKMDIRRFFESTATERIHQYFSEIGWDAEAAELLTGLTTYNGHLPQGAPTSPKLSNLVNARLDETLLRLAQRHKGAYSRYADDITMSFPKGPGRRFRGLTQAVRRTLRKYGYTMHGGRKLKYFRRHQRQQVLGLVVNEKVDLPRKTRRWLRSVRHHMRTGKPTTLTEAQLQGWEALQRMVNLQRQDD